MKQCKSCSKEISTKAKICPGCGAKNKKPIYKRAWFIVLAFFIVVGAMGSGESDEDTTTNTTSDTTTVVEETSQTKEKEEDNVPTEYKSALKKAKSYSDMMNMSKQEYMTN